MRPVLVDRLIRDRFQKEPLIPGTTFDAWWTGVEFTLRGGAVSPPVALTDEFVEAALGELRTPEPIAGNPLD